MKDPGQRLADLVTQEAAGALPPLQFLNATGSKVLVEASPLDRIWGIGLATGHEDVNCPSRWRGLNLLGFALMNVRDALSGARDIGTGRQDAR